jgi:aryl-alcohol dehydrogenase-like predicted oxidoreductase
MSRASLGPHTVNRIGFGAMQLPGPGVFGPPRDHDAAVAVLRRAVDLGVDHIDTSQYYGPDVANALIREALHPYPDRLVLVSKVGARRDAKGGWLPAQRPEELRSGVEDNLRSLAIDCLGAVNLRLITDHDELPADQRVSYEDQLAVMAALRDEGKIAGIGVSTASLAEVDQAIEAVGVACVQNAFSLLDQRDASVLDRCHAEGIAYVPYFPLGSAFPGMPKVTSDPVVLDLADRLGATPAQVGLAWLLAHRDNILLIPGTSSVVHLEENVKAGDLVLSAKDLDLLTRSSR